MPRFPRAACESITAVQCPVMPRSHRTAAPIADTTMKQRIRLHFWNSGGAQSVVIPINQERQRCRELIAEGAVMLHSECCQVA